MTSASPQGPGSLTVAVPVALMPKPESSLPVTVYVPLDGNVWVAVYGDPTVTWTWSTADPSPQLIATAVALPSTSGMLTVKSSPLKGVPATAVMSLTQAVPLNGKLKVVQAAPAEPTGAKTHRTPSVAAMTASLRAGLIPASVQLRAARSARSRRTVLRRGADEQPRPFVHCAGAARSGIRESNPSLQLGKLAFYR